MDVAGPALKQEEDPALLLLVPVLAVVHHCGVFYMVMRHAIPGGTAFVDVLSNFDVKPHQIDGWVPAHVRADFGRIIDMGGPPAKHILSMYRLLLLDPPQDVLVKAPQLSHEFGAMRALEATGKVLARFKAIGAIDYSLLLFEGVVRADALERAEKLRISPEGLQHALVSASMRIWDSQLRPGTRLLVGGYIDFLMERSLGRRFEGWSASLVGRYRHNKFEDYAAKSFALVASCLFCQQS